MFDAAGAALSGQMNPQSDGGPNPNPNPNPNNDSQKPPPSS